MPRAHTKKTQVFRESTLQEKNSSFTSQGIVYLRDKNHIWWRVSKEREAEWGKADALIGMITNECRQNRCAEGGVFAGGEKKRIHSHRRRKLYKLGTGGEKKVGGGFTQF